MPNVKSLTKVNKTNAKEEKRKEKLKVIEGIINSNFRLQNTMRFKYRQATLKQYQGNRKNKRKNKINAKKG